MSSLFFVTRCLQLCHSIQGPVTPPQEGRVTLRLLCSPSTPRPPPHVLTLKCSPASSRPNSHPWSLSHQLSAKAMRCIVGVCAVEASPVCQRGVRIDRLGADSQLLFLEPGERVQPHSASQHTKRRAGELGEKS